MSSEARPISPASFALAIEDLPVETLYSKAHEINNSISHLRRSNAALQEYSDSISNDSSLDATTRESGDKDCLDAIRENGVVIDRQVERVKLLKAEVERRGQRWHEADLDDGERKVNGNAGVGGAAGVSSAGHTQGHAQTQAAGQGQVSGRLTDEELHRQIEHLYEQDRDEDGNGMHL